MGYLLLAAGITAVILIAGLAWHNLLIRRQLQSINRQLDKRLRENTRQPLRLELMNKELTLLASHINKCLKAEEKLRLQGIQEERELRELIANISHDLRTPLTAIRGYQQLVMDEGLTPGQQNKLQTAQKHAQALGQLIDHFFEYSYLLQTEPELKVEEINLSNYTAECLAASVAVLEEHRLGVELVEAAPVFVCADKELLSRIIHNLIRNGIQHADGILTVKVILSEDGSRGVLSFSNPVSSASSVNAGRLFERFYTGDQARRGGSGLGLSIVRLLAEQMGGAALATIQEGLLEIRVELPLAARTGTAASD
ncbi:HAMP domain-containing sensor histidine kinase [Paenibacillus sp. DMB5]|uniref:sensor histidine kinase n=1 Tax=Paenibacillus sp. DMB5 TaxID=1780103 RepID=UPI000A6AD189|nr:HAMP domain-containing sensor histidine kinase [Paenibacillus sp. DMB5]